MVDDGIGCIGDVKIQFIEARERVQVQTAITHLREVLAQVFVGSDAIVGSACLVRRPLVAEITIENYYGVILYQ